MPAPLPAPALHRMPTTPSAPRPWTLAETLRTIREHRLTLIETSRGFRVRHRHRHMLPGLDAALAAYAPALRVWRALVLETRAPEDGWDEATWLFASWFRQRLVAPPIPFTLRPGVIVRDGTRYRASVLGRLRLGPRSPYAQDLSAELAALFARFGLEPGAVGGYRSRRAA